VIKKTTLPPGIAASVAGELVEARTVARIASARGLERSLARELAIRDALFAAAVRAMPERADAVVVAERTNLARLLLEAIEKDAENLGPPTEAELGELSAERWTELDRPPSARTTHALVFVKKPEDDAPARALAQKLADALGGATASAEFIERAQAFPAAPLEVRAERVGPVTLDGRMWDPSARPGTKFPTVDLVYAQAALALAHPGDQSPIVKSAFGYHVILLDERIDERRTSLDERRTLLHGDIVSRRAKKVFDATVARVRQQTPVEVTRAADSLTELVLGTP
jgi:hypothetical protein